jgi:hypothetical protein
MIMQTIIRITGVITIVFLFQFCKKDKKDETESGILNDSYTIELNADHRISRITHYSGSNGNSNFFYYSDTVRFSLLLMYSDINYDKVFNYSDRKVIATDFKSGKVLSTYYLNDLGLADSCAEGSYLIKYKYDSENYLISFVNSDPLFGEISMIYSDGNRTGLWNKASYTIPLGYSYDYTSLPNLIDIDYFQGNFLGKLNKNLIAKKDFRWGPHGDNTTTIEYEYVLNNDGLVVQRTAISTNNQSSALLKPKLISKFEYIVK